MKRGKNAGRLKTLVWLALVSVAAVYVLGEWFFNLNSNLVALSYRASSKPLEIGTRAHGWKPVTDVSAAELHAALIERHAEDGLRWQTLRVRRRPEGVGQRLAMGLFGAEVQVITINSSKFEFSTSYLPEFEPTTAKERLQTGQLWFAINANFRDPDDKPLGWVVHEKRQVNPPFPAWTGVFFVKSGRPWFGPKSLLDETPGLVEEGTQVYPSVMKNHTVFSYVELQPNRFFDGKKIAYRSLAGVKRDGSVVFVLSGDGGVMNVAEVTEIARKLDVQHATLLDGGRALQYSLRTADGPWHFHAFNTDLPLDHPWLARQRSPVYIAVRKRAPPVVSAAGP